MIETQKQEQPLIAELPNNTQAKDELYSDVMSFWDDPLGFVRYCWPWMQSGGPLEHYEGPDVWQEQALDYIGQQIRDHAFDGVTPVEPIRIAVPSGHGTGKGAFLAWAVVWILATRPGSKGSLTANTAKQLDTKTWATALSWAKRSIISHWFDWSSERIWLKGQKEDTFCAAITCRPENAEAFQGQHAPNGASFYGFDECSNIDSRIWKAAEGGLTDGEPMFFAFGQPTRADGEFFEITSGRKRNLWKQFPIDSRDSKLTNKQLIADWLSFYGEDDDFIRVHVKGLPPKAGDLQFISSYEVSEAQVREVFSLPDDPLIMGIDYARGGNDKVVIRFRKGFDARSIRPTKIPGEKARDSMQVATKIAYLIRKHKPDAVFGDATGGSIGGPINDRLRQLGFNVIDVQYGGESPDPHYGNMRSFMWAEMRDWLPRAGIDNDRDLEMDLSGPTSKHDRNDRVILESKEDMKKRGVDSPDDGDALASTFAAPVAPKEKRRSTEPQIYGAWS